MRYIHRVASKLRDGHCWLNKKTFHQMHPAFWLNDHLPACSNKDDEDSVEGPEFNQEFEELHDDANTDLSEKENHAAILELAQDLGTDNDNELDSLPLSKLSYQSLIQEFEVLA
jgi:hypothetical protein